MNIKEKEKSDDMRRFNISFDWMIKNDKEETVKKLLIYNLKIEIRR
ncbi:hypothetical protein [Clostridium sp. UBA7503]